MSTQNIIDNIFETPCVEPISILDKWLKEARRKNVQEPGALALATVDSKGFCSNRIVQLLSTDPVLVFTSHSGSQKGRDIAENNWASGVLYWRETKQQIIISGNVSRLMDEDSDVLWSKRPKSTYPMSIVSHQSEVLENENDLRLKAQKLAESDTFLSRPKNWCGYSLEPKIVEFWQAAEDRLHFRLRYDYSPSGWRYCRLQP